MHGSVIEDTEGEILCRAISQRAFAIVGLSYETDPNFGAESELGAWLSDDQQAAGMVFEAGGSFRFVVFRRRVDDRWVCVAKGGDNPAVELAIDGMCDAMKVGEPPEPIPPGSRTRPPLYDKSGRGTYQVLAESYGNLPAKWAVREVYLALPNPDLNFVSDVRNQCEARLWELYLFACFREQGVRVSQDLPSPNFEISRLEYTAFVEAVTANPKEPGGGGAAESSRPPKDTDERMAGGAAARFAKTIGSKLQRRYENMPHVAGKPFALAVADFHAPSSMVWSRESLPTYLYGFLPEVVQSDSGPLATTKIISHLLGPDSSPAGIFRDPAFADLSAVIFSNGATIAKFNRMGFLAGVRPEGIAIRRRGVIYDRRPGSLEPIEFDGDILGADYAALWPGGEKWCQELEVFHNPNAKHPFSHDLLPGATHWFERAGHVVSEAFWQNTFLASTTMVQIPRGTSRRRIR